jgi:hypothetical protein
MEEEFLAAADRIEIRFHADFSELDFEITRYFVDNNLIECATIGGRCMKRIVVVTVMLCSYTIVLFGQAHYKQNFLTAFGKQPVVKTCEEAYSILTKKGKEFNAFAAMKDDLAKSTEELAALQNSLAMSANATSAPAMNAEDAKKLQDQLQKMTDAERQQWAMQNASKLMAPQTVHANKDMDNQTVMDAVEYVADRNAQNQPVTTFFTESTSQFTEIEAKYHSQIESLVKKFQAASGTNYDPSVLTNAYIFGEASEEEIARYDRALKTFNNDVLPIYNNEMKDKLNWLQQQEKTMVQNDNTTEEKIAQTHYGDDAQEPFCRQTLIMGHMNVLNRVTPSIAMYEDVLYAYADKYAAITKSIPAKKMEN